MAAAAAAACTCLCVNTPSLTDLMHCIISDCCVNIIAEFFNPSV